MTQEHAKYEQEVIYGTTYDTYINSQQSRLCGAPSGLSQLLNNQPRTCMVFFCNLADPGVPALDSVPLGIIPSQNPPAEVGGDVGVNDQPTTQDGPLPVIILSHGLGGMRTTYCGIFCDIASHDYVVAAVEHRWVPDSWESLNLHTADEVYMCQVLLCHTPFCMWLAHELTPSYPQICCIWATHPSAWNLGWL